MCRQEEEEYRYRQTVIDEFLEKHPKEDMELCVLKDNEGAVKLYQDCGFLVVEEYPGFSTNPIKPKAVGMTRVSNNTER